MVSITQQTDLWGKVVPLEKLSRIELGQYLARALKQLSSPPQWQHWEKAVIAWAICFDGYIDAKNNVVGLGVTDTRLMDAWWRLVKGFGNRGSYKKGGDGLKWRVCAVREVLYLLANIYPFLPDKRKRAKAVMDYCVRRIAEEEVS